MKLNYSKHVFVIIDKEGNIQKIDPETGGVLNADIWYMIATWEQRKNLDLYFKSMHLAEKGYKIVLVSINFEQA